MITRTDIEDLPDPESRPAPGANKPERCNTRIIDPALLADIVPLGPPESRRAASEPPARPDLPASARFAPSLAMGSQAAPNPRAPRYSLRARRPAEASPSPVPPTAKTMVVAYAPRPARRPQRARRALLVVAGVVALGGAGWLWITRAPSPGSASVAAVQDRKIAFGEGPPEAFTEDPRTPAPDSTMQPSAAESTTTATPANLPRPETTSTAAPSATPKLSGTAAAGNRSGTPAGIAPGPHPAMPPPMPPPIPTASTHAPATATTSTMVFPSD